MATITKFEDLEVWQQARSFSIKVWQLTSGEKFRREFSLVDQMRRSAGSIMDNIAEGFGRGGRNEFINFLYYAKGSANELQSQLYRALDFQLISQKEFVDLNGRCHALEVKLRNFIDYLKKSEFKGTKFKDRKA